MSGKKTFTNNSNQTLYVTLFVRNGDNPDAGDSGTVKFMLKPNTSQVHTYGTDTNDNFLNGISFAWDDDGTRLTKMQMVTKRGCWWDDVMNTNSYITWNGVGKANITGSNVPAAKEMAN